MNDVMIVSTPTGANKMLIYENGCWVVDGEWKRILLNKKLKKVRESDKIYKK